jgi:hypothetical protein
MNKLALFVLYSFWPNISAFDKHVTRLTHASGVRREQPLCLHAPSNRMSDH